MNVYCGCGTVGPQWREGRSGVQYLNHCSQACMGGAQSHKIISGSASLGPGVPSTRADILERYGGFFRGLRRSPSREVAVMANLVGRDLPQVGTWIT